MKKGFTLVELVIVIAIVIVLSIVSVPIYRSYVDKAMRSEGYALLGTLLTAEKAYYREYGFFYWSPHNRAQEWSCYYPEMGVDARGNRYFTSFYLHSDGNMNKNSFYARVKKPVELKDDKHNVIGFLYSLTANIIFEDLNE